MVGDTMDAQVGALLVAIGAQPSRQRPVLRPRHAQFCDGGERLVGGAGALAFELRSPSHMPYLRQAGHGHRQDVDRDQPDRHQRQPHVVSEEQYQIEERERERDERRDHHGRDHAPHLLDRADALIKVARGVLLEEAGVQPEQTVGDRCGHLNPGAPGNALQREAAGHGEQRREQCRSQKRQPDRQQKP